MAGGGRESEGKSGEYPTDGSSQRLFISPLFPPPLHATSDLKEGRRSQMRRKEEGAALIPEIGSSTIDVDKTLDHNVRFPQFQASTHDPKIRMF